MIVVEFTEEQALGLRNLLNVAVQAAGMRVAEFAVTIDHIILTAAANQKKPNGKSDDGPALQPN